MILCYCARCARCEFSVCCMNISAIMLEDGAPIATFPHLLPHSQVTGIPNDSINRWQPHNHPTSLGKAFCHSCLYQSSGEVIYLSVPMQNRHHDVKVFLLFVNASVLSLFFLTSSTGSRKLITTHNLCSQAHFHNNPSTTVHVSVHYTGHQMIKHILFLNFIQRLQCVLPPSAICKSHAVYNNPTPKIQCIAGMPSFSAYSWTLCKNYTRKYRDETVVHILNVQCYIFNA